MVTLISLTLLLVLRKDMPSFLFIISAQSAGAGEYTNCISAEKYPSPNECPGYDIKQSNGEVAVMLELWGMLCTPSLPSLPGPLWPQIVAPDKLLSMGQIELFDIQTECKQMIYAKLNCLK